MAVAVDGEEEDGACADLADAFGEGADCQLWPQRQQTAAPAAAGAAAAAADADEAAAAAASVVAAEWENERVALNGVV